VIRRNRSGRAGFSAHAPAPSRQSRRAARRRRGRGLSGQGVRGTADHDDAKLSEAQAVEGEEETELVQSGPPTVAGRKVSEARPGGKGGVQLTSRPRSVKLSYGVIAPPCSSNAARRAALGDGHCRGACDLLLVAASARLCAVYAPRGASVHCRVDAARGHYDGRGLAGSGRARGYGHSVHLMNCHRNPGHRNPDPRSSAFSATVTDVSAPRSTIPRMSARVLIDDRDRSHECH